MTNKNNQTLTLKVGLESAREVCDLIKDLSNKFRIHYRKGESVDLVYSQAGTVKEPVHNLAVWFSSDNLREVNYFEDLIEKMP